MERALIDGGAASNKENSSRMRMMIRKGENKIKRIENLSSRQVTFSKRRTSLLKKAYELSVLCDAQVAVIVFSSTGRLSEFANPNMPNILQKYQEIAGTKQESGQSFQNLEYWKHEAVLLKQQIEFFRMQESFLLGENLTCFQLKDLEILESKLCNAINKIREHKMECLQLHVQEIYKKENHLLQENNMLRHQIADVMESKRDRTTTTTTATELRSASRHTTTCCAAACTPQCALRTFDVSLKLGLKP